MSTKHEQLLVLTRIRQKCRWDGYKCIGDYHHGKYECDFVSPYTRSANNVDAELMVLLQDWACDEVLSGAFLEARRTIGHDPNRWTNIHLKELLKAHFDLELAAIYATNVFPFVKFGKMNAGIKRKDLDAAAEQFALPQIQIVGPRIAVCLGKSSFNAIARAAGQSPAKALNDAIASPFHVGKTQIWCQAHTGRQGRNFRNRGGVDRVSKDWSQMAVEFSAQGNSV
jgi:restriction system protein